MKRWRRIASVAVGFALIISTVQAAVAETARYDVDPDHSTIGFSVDHIIVSKTRGQFIEYTGFIEMDPDAKHEISHRARAFRKLVDALF